MTDDRKPAPEEMAFGDALAELEAIIAGLESGQLDLEVSLARCERGVSLLRALQGKLSDAQQRVTMLLGELEAEDRVPESASPEDQGAIDV